MRIPNMYILQLSAGATLDGTVGPTTVTADQPTSAYNGRDMRWADVTAGGLFELPSGIGTALYGVYANLPGVTQVDIYIRDSATAQRFLVHSETASPTDFVWSAPANAPMALPSGAIVVVATGVLGGEGQLQVNVGPSWQVPYFSDVQVKSS